MPSHQQRIATPTADDRRNGNLGLGALALTALSGLVAPACSSVDLPNQAEHEARWGNPKNQKYLIGAYLPLPSDFGPQERLKSAAVSDQKRWEFQLKLQELSDVCSQIMDQWENDANGFARWVDGGWVKVEPSRRELLEVRSALLQIVLRLNEATLKRLDAYRSEQHARRISGERDTNESWLEQSDVYGDIRTYWSERILALTGEPLPDGISLDIEQAGTPEFAGLSAQNTGSIWVDDGPYAQVLSRMFHEFGHLSAQQTERLWYDGIQLSSAEISILEECAAFSMQLAGIMSIGDESLRAQALDDLRDQFVSSWSGRELGGSLHGVARVLVETAAGECREAGKTYNRFAQADQIDPELLESVKRLYDELNRLWDSELLADEHSILLRTRLSRLLERCAALLERDRLRVLLGPNR